MLASASASRQGFGARRQGAIRTFGWRRHRDRVPPQPRPKQIRRMRAHELSVMRSPCQSGGGYFDCRDDFARAKHRVAFGFVTRHTMEVRRTGIVRAPFGPSTFTIASRAANATATSDELVAIQASLKPNRAAPRSSPSSAEQPQCLAGACCTAASTSARNRRSGVRCIMLPPIEAMLRTCAEALLSSACEIGGIVCD